MSGLSVAGVRAARPAVLEAAARELDDQRAGVQGVLVLVVARRGLGLAWSGPAADAAAVAWGRTLTSLGRVSASLGASAEALRRAADEVRGAQAVLARAEARARAAGAVVDASGTLLLPVRATGVDPVVSAHQRRQDLLLVDDVRSCLEQSRRLADAADLVLVRDLALAARGAPAAPSGTAAQPVPPPPAPPPGGHGVRAQEAYAAAAWWRGLSEDQRRRALLAHPEWVGPRDGVPAWARHEANLRLLLGAERAARAEVARTQRAGLTPYDVEMAAVARRRVGELRAVRDVLAVRDGNERQLLLVDASGPDLRAVLSVGDVGTARHVVTFVGGFTTTVGQDLRRYDAQLVALRSDTVMASRGERVAVVTWMGYDAPQIHEVATGSRSVLRPDLARAAGDDLAAFLTGVAAARDAPVHQTVWAHSYGSVVAGFALLRPSPVDDVVVMGSPGLPFDDVGDTGLDVGGLGEVHAPDDAVVRYGPLVLGTPAARVRGVVGLSATGPGERASHGHSDYLRRGSSSARALVRVAAGKGARGAR